MPNLPNVIADWPAPANICALTTTMAVGHSLPPYAHNNLALHVGDNAEHVLLNRRQLVTSLHLPNEPAWLEQTHSTDCVVIEKDPNRVADAATTRQTSSPLVIMTADCLPIVLCDLAGTEIAAIHAGWRGLAQGIVENTLAKMHHLPSQLIAWIGPSICHTCFEIGSDVKDTYLKRYPYTSDAFHNNGSRLFADLPKLAELILQTLGIFGVFQSGACTYEQNKTFYSYRRQAQTGRIATLIWFKK